MRTATQTWHADDGAYCCRYHDTIISRISDTRIELDNGGFHTVTTKRRMNQELGFHGIPFRVFQDNFEWFLGMFPNDGFRPIPFNANGMLNLAKVGGVWMLDTR